LEASGNELMRVVASPIFVVLRTQFLRDKADPSFWDEVDCDHSDIAEAIKLLKGTTTVLLIAHRLSSVKSADTLIFMKDGKIAASGTFDEVRKIAPDFDKQANLMGL
jgi:ABC-type thiamine transport system ATPase subunit